jgi:hypothetical protein
MSQSETEAVFHLVRDTIEANPPDIKAILAEGKRHRRRRRGSILLAGAATAVAAVLTLGGLTQWLDVASPDHQTANETQAVPLPWVADGVLHLATVDVQIGDFNTLAAVGSSAAYTTLNGDVVFVESDGTRHVLGHTYGSVVADSATGWLSWVEMRGDHHPELVVYDTTTSRDLGRLPLSYDGPRFQTLDAGSEPLAIDNGTVYYAAEDGDYAWDVTAGTNPQRVTDTNTYLRDHQGGVAIVQQHTSMGYGPAIIKRPGAADLTVKLEGFDRLSPDGNHLLIVHPSLSSLPGAVEVIDTRTGATVNIHFDAGVTVQAGTFIDDNNILIATAHLAPAPTGPQDGILGVGSSQGPASLLSCGIDTAQCTTLETTPADTIQLPGS